MFIVISIILVIINFIVVLIGISVLILNILVVIINIIVIILNIIFAINIVCGPPKPQRDILKRRPFGSSPRVAGRQGLGPGRLPGLELWPRSWALTLFFLGY